MKPLHRYRVALSSWESWSLIVRAESAEAAEKEALTLWETEGEEVFKHRGGGVDVVEAYPLDDRETRS